MAYRLYDPNPTFVNLLGTDSAAGGSLTFYDIGTTTPKNTYSDQDLTTPNTNPVLLDSDGRAATEIWLDGEYTVILKDADDTTVWTRDVVPEVAPGAAIPSQTGHSGEFLTTDGTNPAWTALFQLPDPAGSAGYMVTVNPGATDYQLEPVPEPPVIPEPDIAIGTADIAIGDGTYRLMIQTGTDTAPASGTRETNKAVTFPTAFTSIFFAAATANISAVGSFGIGATSCATGYTAGSPSTGCTFTFNSADDGGDSGYTIINNIPFNWFAIGLVAV